MVAIIGVLAAIAIPQFGAYRERGFRARIQSDARNAATAEEAYFAEANAYSAATAPRCPASPSPMASLSPARATRRAFTITATHPGAPSFQCTYTSNPGGREPEPRLRRHVSGAPRRG